MSATKPKSAEPYGIRTANGVYATTTYWTPGTYPTPMPYTYDYFLSEPITQVKGKVIRFQMDFTIHDFADANEFYCGVRGWVGGRVKGGVAGGRAGFVSSGTELDWNGNPTGRDSVTPSSPVYSSIHPSFHHPPIIDTHDSSPTRTPPK